MLISYIILNSILAIIVSQVAQNVEFALMA